MGFFSWKTADTKKSIYNIYSGKEVIPVHVLCPDGGVISEDAYTGYGKFGGYDVYALLARWNIPEQCKDKQGNWLTDDEIRVLGIRMDSPSNNLKYRIKIVEDKTLSYADVEASENCPYQGYFSD
jgi:hypothetical protein